MAVDGNNGKWQINWEIIDDDATHKGDSFQFKAKYTGDVRSGLHVNETRIFQNRPLST